LEIIIARENKGMVFTYRENLLKCNTLEKQRKFRQKKDFAIKENPKLRR